MEPSGLGAGGLLIEQGEPVMVSVRKSAMRLGLALWPELPERAVVRLVHAGTAAADAGLRCFDVTGRPSNLAPTHRPADPADPVLEPGRHSNPPLVACPPPIA